MLKAERLKTIRKGEYFERSPEELTDIFLEAYLANFVVEVALLGRNYVDLPIHSKHTYLEHLDYFENEFHYEELGAISVCQEMTKMTIRKLQEAGYKLTLGILEGDSEFARYEDEDDSFTQEFSLSALDNFELTNSDEIQYFVRVRWADK